MGFLILATSYWLASVPQLLGLGLAVYVARSRRAPFSYDMRRSAASCSNRRRHKNEMPDGINPTGQLVLATSYSRTTFRRTTIGAAAFHFRVRNGNGWGHCARVTRNLPRRLSRQISGA